MQAGCGSDRGAPRFCRASRHVRRGTLSARVAIKLPILQEKGPWAGIVKAVDEAFEAGPRSKASDKYDGAHERVL